MILQSFEKTKKKCNKIKKEDLVFFFYFINTNIQNINKNIQNNLFIKFSFFKNKFLIFLLLKNIETIKNQISGFKNIQIIINIQYFNGISGVNIVENIHKNIKVAFGFTIVVKYHSVIEFILYFLLIFLELIFVIDFENTDLIQIYIK